ncbi:MAG: hypothetical protein M1834_000097 [Cirrosporium novae-zelandiae]|nr:MAG: hypothetical protein M1834_000097 [Cirrosporium novae-zelandiae]
MEDNPRSRLPRPTSAIPRISKLPLPRASVSHSIRPSPSREKLRADPGLDYSRLQTKPSQERLTVGISTYSNDGLRSVRRLSSYSNIYLKSDDEDGVFKKPEPRSSSRIRVPMRPVSRQSQNTEDAIDEDSEEVSTALKHIDANGTGTARRKPRPSLSDRTIETLSQIPPSPSPGRRKSGFFPPESPMGLPGRPTSSMGSSRPSSSSDRSPTRMNGFQRPASPTKRLLAPGASMGNSSSSSISRRSFSMATSKTRLSKPSEAEEAYEPTSSPSQLQFQGIPRPTSSHSATTEKALPLRGSKTMTARVPKPRPSLNEAFSKPPPVSARKSPPASAKKSPTKESSKPDTKKVSHSSATLRETIAKAKALKAAKAARAPVDPFDFEFAEDPFNTSKDKNDGLLRKKIDTGRTTGSLNIAAMGLTQIPDEVMNMYEFDSSQDAGAEWYESVDLVKFIAADNEIQEIREDAFPDTDPKEDFMQNEDSKGNQFGGLETLDLHGNKLNSLPLGLRRLEHLTVLNLSNNKVGGALDIIFQIKSLKDLRLGNNELEGCLPEQIGQLHHLEVLDLRNNMLSELPQNLVELVNLRVLQLSQNQLSRIPIGGLMQSSLTELSASRNKLSGSLIPSNVQLPKLQQLDICTNMLSRLSEDDMLELPSLQRLLISENRLTVLPDMSSWEKLLTIIARDNNIAKFPEGLLILPIVKNIDFTGNDLSKLDERICLMESLTNLDIGNNPLRERKFLSMGTEEIKSALRQRLQPEETDEFETAREGSDSSTSRPWTPETTSVWPIKPGGLLDLSSTKLEELDADQLQIVAAKQDIRSIDLRQNLIKFIPAPLTMLVDSLVTLNLSHNSLTGEEYFLSPLSLNRLKTLAISSNAITSLGPLLEQLTAPLLEHLDVSCNRLTELPLLRPSFPAISTVIASDNAIEELDVEAVRGLKVLDMSRNSIGHLPPKLGLFERELKSFEVMGNLFKVPRYNILEKGTEATLAWLKDKIPLDEREETDY